MLCCQTRLQAGDQEQIKSMPKAGSVNFWFAKLGNRDSFAHNCANN
jgi:hypothetical protein